MRHSRTSPGAIPAGYKRPRILIADDDPAILEVVQAYLESSGYEVGIALDGNRALDMGSNESFDLLILDVHMPIYGGAEVLQMLRKRLLSHPLKVIALTADVRWTLREEMQRDGVDAYLVKPVSLVQLGKEVARLLKAESPARKAFEQPE